MPGEIYHGNLTYDNINIPETGSYTIGMYLDESRTDIVSDEIQSLLIEWTTPFYGNQNRTVNFILNYSQEYALLNFYNGALIGFHLLMHQDMDIGIEDEKFNEIYYGLGNKLFVFDFQGESFTDLARCEIMGTVHFPVPEPKVPVLFTIGLICSMVIKRKVNTLGQ
jgi:hypothetical protein